MRLTLTYDGPLPAATTKNLRAAEKNEIRRKLHPQLLDAWRTHPALTGYLDRWETEVSTQFSSNGGAFIVAHKVEDYVFIPTITKRHHMICELDILFLRREQPGALVHGGDLDNRLKTLFDALSIPDKIGQLAGLSGNEPSPFCCLLEDDRLITALNLRTAQLHEPVNEKGSANDVRLIIEVTIRVTRLTYWNMGVGG